YEAGGIVWAAAVDPNNLALIIDASGFGEQGGTWHSDAGIMAAAFYEAGQNIAGSDLPPYDLAPIIDATGFGCARTSIGICERGEVAAFINKRDIWDHIRSYIGGAGCARRAAANVLDAHVDLVLALVRIGVRTINGKAAAALRDDGADRARTVAPIDGRGEI